VKPALAFWCLVALSACNRALDLPIDIEPGAPPIRVDGGQPMPETVIISYDVSRVIADDAHLYWSDTQIPTSVRGCLSATCPASALEFAHGAQDAVEPGGLAADAQYVYWADGAGLAIHRCPIDGCAAEGPETIAGGHINPNGVALDGDTIYFGDADTSAVLRCPTTGCVGAPEVMATGQFQPDRLAVDADYVYWLQGGPASAIRRVAKSSPGSTPETLVQVSDLYPHSLALHGGYVYFTSTIEGVLRRCAVVGCNNEPEQVSPVGLAPLALIMDDAHIYWLAWTSTSGLGDVLRCPVAGCGGADPDVLATAQPISGDDQAIAVDATYVYWANVSNPSGANNGAVMRIAK
jgi:hypothetical protein